MAAIIGCCTTARFESPQAAKILPGACLQDVHTLLCQLIESSAPMPWRRIRVHRAKYAHRLAPCRSAAWCCWPRSNMALKSLLFPREVKAYVAGYGHADKKQMQLMVRALLKMEETQSRPMPPTPLPSRSATFRVNNSRGASGSRRIQAPRQPKVLWPIRTPPAARGTNFRSPANPMNVFSRRLCLLLLCVAPFAVAATVSPPATGSPIARVQIERPGIH